MQRKGMCKVTVGLGFPFWYVLVPLICYEMVMGAVTMTPGTSQRRLSSVKHVIAPTGVRRFTQRYRGH